MDSHKDAYFEAGDTIQLEKTASVPTAEVQEIVFENGTLHYRLKWSNGNTNTQPVDEMDAKANNKTPKF